MPQPVPDPARPWARLTALTVAAAGGFAVWLSWDFFVNRRAGRIFDEAAREGAAEFHNQVWRIIEPVLDVISEPFVAIVILVGTLVAVLRGRWLIAGQVAVLVGGANLTTQLLKNQVLDRPRLGVMDIHNSLPSGHTTVAASVAAALVLVLPRRGRVWATLLGAGYVALVGAGTVTAQWHRPSDVVAAILVVLAWFALVCAFSPRSTFDDQVPAGKQDVAITTTIAVTLLAVFALLGVLACLWIGSQLRGTGLIQLEMVDHKLAFAGGLAMIITCVAVAFFTMLLLRQGVARAARGAETRGMLSQD